jgi:hypothetical protein
MEVDVAGWIVTVVSIKAIHNELRYSPMEVPWARVIGDEPDGRILVLTDDSDVSPHRIGIVEWLSSALHDAERML